MSNETSVLHLKRKHIHTSTDTNWLILNTILVLATLITAWLIAVRDRSIGSDTDNYTRFFYSVTSGQDHRISEPIFVFLSKFSAAMGGSETLFFFLIATIAIWGVFKFYVTAAQMGTSRNNSLAVAMLAIAILPFWKFFTEMQVNIIRTAAAMPFFYFSLSFFFQKRFISAGVALAVATGFHNSMPVFALAAPLMFLRPRTVAIVILVASALYATGISEFLVRGVIPNEWLTTILAGNERYLTTTNYNYNAGIRLDFLAFSLFFLFVAYPRDSDKNSTTIYYIYSVLLMPFLIGGFIPYSDRLLSLAWGLIPLIISLYIVPKVKNTAISILSFLVILFWPAIFFMTTLIPQ